MTKAARAVPKGLHTITPHLVVRDAAKAIDFYKRALGAEEISRFPGPDGRSIMHAEIKIGDSVVYLNDENPQMGARSPLSIGGTAVTLTCYVEDADALYNRAVGAGAKVQMPIADQFWGDRYGQVIDPYGHQWSICTRKEDLTPEEMQKKAEQFFAATAKK